MSKPPVEAQRGMVAASQPRAARIGCDVLRAGGTAVDAAIAVNAALGLMEPTGCGVGGDLFALLWDNEARQLVGLNASGRSARAGSLDDVRQRAGGDRIPARGGLSVSVPGAVDGWFRAHERYGRLPLAALLAPAIDDARGGFEVTPVIAGAWARAENVFAGNADFARTFLPGGRAPRPGETFRNEALAATYELIAREGRSGFYDGDLARDVAACVQAAGGLLQADDLASHVSEWVQPLSVRYRGHELWELPPNGQGLAALQMMAVLEGFDLASMSPAERLHLMIEAKKLAFEDRARLYADPDFARAPLADLLSDEYAARRRSLIDTARAASRYDAGAEVLRTGDTVYLVTADADGNLASWIQSNYMGFGSGLVPPGRGFGLQNRGCLFSLDASLDGGHANAWEPGKRPFNTIIPAMLTRDGSPAFAFGVMGGDFQPQGHAQILTHLLDDGLDVQAAGDAPRWRHEGSSTPTGDVMTDGGVVRVEAGVPDDVVEELRRRGHRVERDDDPEGYGGYQGVYVEGIAVEGVADEPRWRYVGGSESRKDGESVGW